MNNIPQPISVSSFYHSDLSNNRKRLLENTSDSIKIVMPYKVRRLVDGPAITWKIFKKQADALSFASVHKHQLMAFAFETGKTRLFLAAHPEVFWFYDSQKPSHLRSTYEIIPEHAACKLYFDIEYSKVFNPSKEGHKMVSNFIKLIIYFLRTKLSVDCSPEDILNLDSSTKEKFSCHLIFNITGVCFGSNKQAGNFVSYVCNEIMHFKEKDVPLQSNLPTLENYCDLFVKDQKGNLAIFCDTSVYSRNRQFRLYKSSKFGKNSPLLISSSNKFKPTSTTDYDQEIFFASLITYLPGDYEKLKVINFDFTTDDKIKLSESVERPTKLLDNVPSPFKNVDEFINEVVRPGKIFRSCYFSSSNVLNYDIIGNRFCGNIGRQHKSNNVKYIVDLNEGVYYQKCHDFDCRDYKSEKKALPSHLQLVNNTGEDVQIGSFNTSPEASTNTISLQRFPSCGLSDDDILNHIE